MDQLLGIRVFREVVESNSFVGASERLGISPPMASKHISRLEQQLGARLLNRSSRHVSLTEAGTLYYEQCRQALDILDAAESAVGQTSDAPRGELKVAAPVWCATGRFAEVLTRYRAAYPDVRLDMHLDNHRVDLTSEGFDLALRATKEPSGALIARPLCKVAFQLVATPAYLDGCASSGERAPLQLILPNYVQIDQVKMLGITVTTVMKSSDTNLSYQAVLAGMGAAALPDWLIDQDLASGRLVVVPDTGPLFDVTLFAVYTSRRYMPPKLRSFIDFLSEAL